MSDQPVDQAAPKTFVPASTACQDIVILCRAYSELALSGLATENPTSTPFIRAREVTLRHLEDEIISLMPFIGPDDLGARYHTLPKTLSNRVLEAARAHGICPKPFSLTQDIFDWHRRGPEVFLHLVEAGLMPPTAEEDCQKIIDLILEKCLDAEVGDLWRNVLETWCASGHYLAGDILAHIRERSSRLPAHLTNFCAKLVEDQAQAQPDAATMQIRGAIIGSCSFDVVALLLAGAQLPIKHKKLGGGPKVKAIAELASTRHGRLALLSSLGPLEAWFDHRRRGTHPVLEQHRFALRHLPA